MSSKTKRGKPNHVNDHCRCIIYRLIRNWSNIIQLPYLQSVGWSKQIKVYLSETVTANQRSAWFRNGLI